MKVITALIEWHHTINPRVEAFVSIFLFLGWCLFLMIMSAIVADIIEEKRKQHEKDLFFAGRFEEADKKKRQNNKRSSRGKKNK